LPVAIGLYRGWYVPSGTGPLSALGTLEATEVAISSEVTARSVDIAVDEGQALRAGDVLVRLDESLPQVQYRQGAAADQQPLQVQLAHYTLTAPLAGTVLRRSAEPGEAAVAGAPLLVVMDVAHPELTVYLLQRDIGRVYVGWPVRVEAEAIPSAAFPGTVKSISDRAEYTPRNTQTAKDRENLVFAVKVRVQNADQRLKPGMNVAVRFVE